MGNKHGSRGLQYWKVKGQREPHANAMHQKSTLLSIYLGQMYLGDVFTSSISQNPKILVKIFHATHF